MSKLVKDKIVVNVIMYDITNLQLSIDAKFDS